MIKEFSHLTPVEQDLLIKAPVLLSVLVSSSENQVNKIQMNDAIKLAHLRTFTAPPELHAYYQEVDKIFKTSFAEALEEYFPYNEQKRVKLLDLIDRIKRTIYKIPGDYGKLLSNSLESYSSHVNKSKYSVLRHIIFPISFSKLE